MIVPMKKVSIVLLDSERKIALEKLRDLGVVHLEQLEGTSEVLTAFKIASDNALTALSILGEIKSSKKSVQHSLTHEQVLQKCSDIIGYNEEKKQLADEAVVATTELDRLASWGEVTPEDFSWLSQKGISLRMFEIPDDKYALLPETCQTMCVNRLHKITRFLLINGGEERPANFPPEAYEVAMPALSTKELKTKISRAISRIKELEASIEQQVVYTTAITNFKKDLEADIEFENVYAGMGKDTEGKATDLAWLSGFVPIDSYKNLQEVAKANMWALASDTPDEEDAVPTKLKNNPLVSLIYPLTDFLGTVPGYHEYDISGWFLLFFTIFFGMIFGDGGYGLLLTLGAFVGILKSLASGRKPSGTVGLLLLLGLSTVAWGLVTCTWFGLTPEQLPLWLTQLSVPPLSNAFADIQWLPIWTSDISNGTLSTAQNLQIFCFTLAFLQLSVAHIKGIGRYHKSLRCLGELGSLLQLWGMYYVVLSMVVSSTIFSFGEVAYGIPIGTWAIRLVAIGFALSFIFANYEGNIFESIMASLKGIISVLLGVVNVFSDIVSYIRLWAVGLAGAAISNTVNTMAGPILGHAILFLTAVLLLVFGHGLNMILNLLSVIVHGVRLNTLEFSTHLGMSWSGFKYAPFCTHKRDA